MFDLLFSFIFSSLTGYFEVCGNRFYSQQDGAALTFYRTVYDSFDIYFEVHPVDYSGVNALNFSYKIANVKTRRDARDCITKLAAAFNARDAAAISQFFNDLAR